MDKCLSCENTFPRKYRSKGVRKLYCGRECAWQAYKQVRYDKVCKTCGNSYKAGYNKKNSEYCSKSCIQRSKCQVCEKMIIGRVYFQSTEKIFCSRKCSNFFHKTLKTNNSYIVKGFAQSIHVHGTIMCNRCKSIDIDILCVHHIDKNRKNNSYDNLETLCANCHYKIHWKNSTLRKRYVGTAKLLHEYDFPKQL